MDTPSPLTRTELTGAPPKRILIVEDDSDTRLAYHILLQVKEYETYFAKDPMSCLWEAHRHRPDIILLDIGLEAGDGFGAMEHLRAAAHLGNIPIVIISARDAREYEKRALDFGAKAYLQKPVDQRILLAVISRLIGQSSSKTPESEHAGLRRLTEASM